MRNWNSIFISIAILFHLSNNQNRDSYCEAGVIYKISINDIHVYYFNWRIKKIRMRIQWTVRFGDVVETYERVEPESCERRAYSKTKVFTTVTHTRLAWVSYFTHNLTRWQLISNQVTDSLCRFISSLSFSIQNYWNLNQREWNEV